jgi:hypothetical protein
VRGIAQGSRDLAVVEDLINGKEVGADGRERNQYLLGYNDPEAHKETDYWLQQASERLRTEKENSSKETPVKES